MERKNIAVVYGGYSTEVEISIQSGRNIADNIDRGLFNVYEVFISREKWVVKLSDEELPIDRADFTFNNGGERVVFDLAYITIHGHPGEDGILQAYFELIGLRFTTCSSFVCTLAFDKYSSKAYMKSLPVKMAKDLFLRKGEEYDIAEIVTKLGLPLFVKPNNAGSSFGISKVKQIEDLEKAIQYAFEEGDTLILEEGLDGRELTCGVYMKQGQVVTLPLLEIVTMTEYFDYEAKYEGKSKEICPAPIEKAVWDKVTEQTTKIYKHFGCKGLVRVDYIVQNDIPYFLEINITPGMTNASIVPQMVRQQGMEIKHFLTENILENL